MQDGAFAGGDNDLNLHASRQAILEHVRNISVPDRNLREEIRLARDVVDTALELRRLKGLLENFVVTAATRSAGTTTTARSMGSPTSVSERTHRTPAMAQNIINKPLTIKELLLIRPQIIP